MLFCKLFLVHKETVLKTEDLKCHPWVVPFCFPHPFLGFIRSYQHVHKLIKTWQPGVIGLNKDSKFFRKLLGNPPLV